MHARDTNELVNWLKGKRFLSLTRRDNDWLIAFDEDAHLAAQCLWRLIENGSVKRTSEDHGQWFGLPKPVDASAEVNRRIANQKVGDVKLGAGTLDLELHFESEVVLQVIPDSAGYEAWVVRCPIGEFIAMGGGGLDYRANLPPKGE
ncbi:hypothetical protein B7486_07935 [cyanobacterium TDX16]|nr:hypothetical protein B7486_07935 [cyanobacterium TDX16]